MPDTTTTFDLATVARAIAGTAFAGSLHHLAVTTSTQTLALAAATAGVGVGVWIADAQTGGRGRGGHTWHSAPNDGLYLSALVTPAIPLPGAMRLSLLTALAAQAAIREVSGFPLPADALAAQPSIDIRWPNDLLLNRRKVGGILIESTAAPATSTRPPMLRFAVIGVGINCNQLTFPPDLDPIATSLRRESPPGTPPISREQLLVAFLRHLDSALAQLTRSPDAPAPDLSRHSTWIAGKLVTVPEDGGYTGITAGLTPDGFLQVRLADNTLRIVRSGGVREPSDPTQTRNSN